MLKKSVWRAYAALGVALTAPLCVTGCTSTDKPPAEAGNATSAPPATPTPEPSPSSTPSEDPVTELGPSAVRVLSTEKLSATSFRLIVIGPEKSVYGYRDGSGKKAQCTQIDRGTQTPPKGLPATSNKQVEMTCEEAGRLTRKSRVLVTVAMSGFSYKFEVPATT